jgi:hypothetical protein
MGEMMSVSLQEERDRLKRERREGTKCRACDKHCQEYRRGINKGMVRVLTLLVKATPGQWANVQDLIEKYNLPRQDRGDFEKLKHWDMIERKPLDDKDDKKSSGLWRATDAGVAWISGLTAVHRYVWLYMDTVQGYDGPKVTVNALFPSFSYQKVMNRKKGQA